jgi:hypothetical protein
MKKGYRFKGSENKVLREILGPKIDAETKNPRKLHNEELYHLYSSPNTVTAINQEA